MERSGRYPSADDMKRIKSLPGVPAYDMCDLFVFDVSFADNNVDQDFEKFTSGSMQSIAGKLIGLRGGISGLRLDNKNLPMVFKTRVEGSGLMKSGGLLRVIGSVFLPVTEESRPFINKVLSGERMTVSLGVMVEKKTCSVCGQHLCTEHLPGSVSEDGSGCHVNLDGVTDVFGWDIMFGTPICGIDHMDTEKEDEKLGNQKIDIVDVKAAVGRGEIEADVFHNLIRLKDTVSGECVVIGKAGETE